MTLARTAPAADAAPAEAPGASADGTAADAPEVVQAREAFRLGSALARQGQWSEALAAFQRSGELRAHPVTTYDIGYCQRALGRPASAYESFDAALKEGEGGALPADIATEARAFLAEAEARIVRVTVSLPAPGLVLRVDGAPVGPLHGDDRATVFLVRRQSTAAAFLPEQVELWLDPGSHAFVLTQANGERVVESRQFAPGARGDLRFAAPEAAPRVASPPAAQGSAGAEHAAPVRTPAWISFGVSAAALTAGAVFGGLALSDRQSLDSDPRCVNRSCPDEPGYRELQDRMVRNADFATVSLAVAGAAALAGTYFWVTAPASHPAPRGGAAVRPVVGAGAVGVAGRF